MITKCKTKVVKSIKEEDYINAFYTETTRSKPYSYSDYIRTDTQLFVGRFSKSDWRKIKVNNVLDFIAGYSPWCMFLLTLSTGALGIVMMTMFYNSFIISLMGFLFILAGFVGILLTFIDFAFADFDDSMLRKFIERIGCEPVRLNAEINTKNHVNANNESFVKHMRKVSEEEFLNIVESFVKWDEAKKAYDELNDTIGYRHEYDDVKLYDFMNEKRQELQKKINKNKAEAEEFEKVLDKDKDTHSAKLVQALQKADKAIAA